MDLKQQVPDVTKEEAAEFLRTNAPAVLAEIESEEKTCKRSNEQRIATRKVFYKTKARKRNKMQKLSRKANRKAA